MFDLIPKFNKNYEKSYKIVIFNYISSYLTNLLCINLFSIV